MNFNDAFKLLIGNEGKLSMDRRDRGNWTSGKIGVGELKGSMFGISSMSYPDEDIQNLSLDRAKEIYLRDYWNKLRINELPSSISFDLFDTAVNSGVTRSIKILQTSVGSEPDGIIGKNTLKAASSIDPVLLKQYYNANRLLFFTEIPAWESQGKGWARRIAHNLLLK
jgi:lysozyme family protein